MVSTKKLLKFRECTKKQKESRIVYLIISVSTYLISMFLVGFKYSIPAVSMLSNYMLKSLQYTQPDDPVKFVIYWAFIIIIGSTTPLIFVAWNYNKFFDKLFFKTKIDIGLKNE